MYNITGYSTALFSSWFNVEELNLLIDAGDGVSAGLLQKSGKVKYVFLTHPDRDHLTGLPQFVQLNARDQFPKLYYPKDSGSFPALQAFLEKFDPHVAASDWQGIEHGSRIGIKKNIVVQALRNEHVLCPPNVNKSLSYKVFEVKRKLKPEFRSISEGEIKAIVKEKGREFITGQIETNILSFSGDTPVDDYAKWDGSGVLIHESTFISGENDARIEAKGNQHSRLDEVMKMVSEITVQRLVLTHFSSRYSREEIYSEVTRLIKEYKVSIPVHIIYPGEIKRDLLRTEPVNA